jgi:hypothetical protein
MKNLLKVEELLLFGLALFLFSGLDYSWACVALYVLGNLVTVPWLMFAALCAIVLGHSSLDRVFGYGLKYPDAFQNTHLGRIGKQNNA